MITKVSVLKRKNDILEEIKDLELKRKQAEKIASNVVKKQLQLQGAFNELTNLEKEL